jgi:hypothetical protein
MAAAAAVVCCGPQFVQLKSSRLLAGNAGELELEVSWRHVPGFEQLNPVKLSALQQLQASGSPPSTGWIAAPHVSPQIPISCFSSR